jgi:hypothetical protein
MTGVHRIERLVKQGRFPFRESYRIPMAINAALLKVSNALGSNNLTRWEALKMSIRVTHQGICQNCVHVGQCVQLQKSTSPVWFCDNFDCTETSECQTVNVILPPKKVVVNQEKFQGLCSNCDQRSYCINARQPGGVWHCEEYR